MSIYKECDIRGIYGSEFDDDTAYDIGRAVGSRMHGKKLAVAGDVRLSTPALKKHLIEGLLESGADVVDIGMAPTPAFYFALHSLDVDGGVTVTASHNPAQYNGFKLMFGDMPVTPEIMADIERRTVVRDYTEGSGSITNADITPLYIESLCRRFRQGSLKVVIDCANGAMSEIALRVFARLGYDVVPLYCTFDGSFPNRDPNPAVYSHLSDLCAAVKQSGADMGIAFDGDGDRVVFVDDRGETVQGEHSFVLMIQKYLSQRPAPVVFDLKSSSVVSDAVKRLGGTPLMERSGHAFIKRRFLEQHAVLAGEISGHFFFEELGYDDGLYAAAVMADIVCDAEEPLSALVSRIPKTLITPDLRLFVPYAERDALLEKVERLAAYGDVSRLDGVRVDFEDGWLLVRKSVTEEAVTLRMEARVQQGMDRIKQLVREQVPELAAVFAEKGNKH